MGGPTATLNVWKTRKLLPWVLHPQGSHCGLRCLDGWWQKRTRIQQGASGIKCEWKKFGRCGRTEPLPCGCVSCRCSEERRACWHLTLGVTTLCGTTGSSTVLRRLFRFTVGGARIWQKRRLGQQGTLYNLEVMGGGGRVQLLSACWLKPRSEDRRRGAQITYSWECAVSAAWTSSHSRICCSGTVQDKEHG
jgi:hypothetical protein